MEHADVVADERCLPRDGRKDRHPLQRLDRQGKRHSPTRSGREKAHSLQGQELQ